jgi:hypothetical protein
MKEGCCVRLRWSRVWSGGGIGESLYFGWGEECRMEGRNGESPCMGDDKHKDGIRLCAMCGLARPDKPKICQR